MEKLEFRPRRVLLVFWLLWTGLGTMVVGCIGAGVSFSAGMSLLFGLLCLPPGFMVGCYCVLYFFSIRYSMDSRYVVKASGVLWKVRRSIPLEKITNIDVRQGPVERLLGFGRIWVFTPSTGSESPEEKLLGVDSPYKMKQTVIDYCESIKKTVAIPISSQSAEAESAEFAILKEILNTLQQIEKKIDGKK